MANTLLTPTMITREALRVLHQRLNFIPNINHQYDDRFAKTPKIGSSLQVRIPPMYSVRTGATLTTQDATESYVTLNVTRQRGVDLTFTSAELALSIDDFSERFLKPAMTTLASYMENDAFSMIDDVYNTVDNIGAAVAFRNFLQGRKILRDNLVPPGDLKAILNTQDNVDMVDTLKGLLNPSGVLSTQYKDGMMGTGAGFEFFENTLIPTHTSGTASLTTAYLLNMTFALATATASLTIDTGSNTIFVGDTISIAGMNRVHPESKADTGVLQQFTVVGAVSANGTSLTVSPPIVVSGAFQNVVNIPYDNAAITKIGGPSAVYKPSLVFHPDAFTFATADLPLPDGVDFARREVQDGISLRCIRQYTISNDSFPCRFDVYYGYKTIRAQLAAKILSN
jgi:hypothetical protein